MSHKRRSETQGPSHITRQKIARGDNIDIIRQELQDKIGNSPVVEKGSFENWSKSIKINDLLVVKPVNLEEIQKVVKAAKQLKLHIRCSGAKHSWGPLFPDEENILMDITNVKASDDHIKLIKDPPNNTKVQVLCSTTVSQLLDFELKNKVNLPANVMLRSVTYSGILGTGCHGVGWDFQALSDFCTQMRIVDSSGKLRTFSKKDDSDMMKAVQCNLGMFGIIYDMQLEVKERKFVHVKNDFTHRAGELFYHPEYLKKLVTSHDSLEIFYWPYSGMTWLNGMKQLWKGKKLPREHWDPKKDGTWVKLIDIPPQDTIDPCDVAGECYYKYLDIRSWLEAEGVHLVDGDIMKYPDHLTPAASKASYEYAKKFDNETLLQPLANAIHYRTHVDMFSVTDMEWAFTVQDDFSNITKACQAVIEILRDDGEKGIFPLNVCMEMRWMKYSDAYLCPAVAGSKEAGGTGHTVYLEILSYSGTTGWEDFANRVAAEWMKIPGARPHWAKEWDYLKNIDTYLRKTWSSQIEKFNEQLAKSECDPDGMFLNKRLQKIFFPDKK